MNTSSRCLKPYSYKTHQHKTQSVTPDSLQPHNPSDPTVGATVALFTFLAMRVATVRT
jgi:hypothetical protein